MDHFLLCLFALYLITVGLKKGRADSNAPLLSLGYTPRAEDEAKLISILDAYVSVRSQVKARRRRVADRSEVESVRRGAEE